MPMIDSNALRRRINKVEKEMGWIDVCTVKKIISDLEREAKENEKHE